jgi:hypothetical protein
MKEKSSLNGFALPYIFIEPTVFEIVQKAESVESSPMSGTQKREMFPLLVYIDILSPSCY